MRLTIRTGVLTPRANVHGRRRINGLPYEARVQVVAQRVRSCKDIFGRSTTKSAGRGTSSCNISFQASAYDGRLPPVPGWPRNEQAPSTAAEAAGESGESGAMLAGAPVAGHGWQAPSLSVSASMHSSSQSPPSLSPTVAAAPVPALAATASPVVTIHKAPRCRGRACHGTSDSTQSATLFQGSSRHHNRSELSSHVPHALPSHVVSVPAANSRPQSAGAAYVASIYGDALIARNASERAKALLLTYLAPIVGVAWALSPLYEREEAQGVRATEWALKKCAKQSAAVILSRQQAASALPICRFAPPACNQCDLVKPKYSTALNVRVWHALAPERPLIWLEQGSTC